MTHKYPYHTLPDWSDFAPPQSDPCPGCYGERYGMFEAAKLWKEDPSYFGPWCREHFEDEMPDADDYFECRRCEQWTYVEDMIGGVCKWCCGE